MGKMHRVLASLLLLIALFLIAGGGWLIALGGSPYYLPAGLLVGFSALLLWRHRPVAAMQVYGLMLVATLVWALWETGLDGWALMARLLAPVALGLILGLILLPRRRSIIGLAGLAMLLIGAGAVLANREQIDAPAPAAFTAATSDGGWEHYGGSRGGDRYSPLTQINTGNVGKLSQAWSYDIGAEAGGGMGSLETTPIAVNGILYACGTNNDVVAIDGDSGKQVWRWAAANDMRGVTHRTCRGVAYFKATDATGPCAARILTATTDARLVALDAATGRPCQGFGNKGAVDLNRGMGDVWKGYYYVTSAPAIVRGKVVLGGWVSDGQKLGEPSGVIRAFDATTGAFAWAWDMAKPDRVGEPEAGDEYSRGTPNSWAPISADEQLGLVYLPTGNATPDYFGAHRSKISETYATSVVALDAETGKPRWHFQTTHHDLWDYDVASQPTLVDVPINGAIVPALLQPTKRGELFFLDRRTGKPLSRVEERRVPTDGVPEERVSPTQPFSVGMPDLNGPRLSEKRMWGATPLDQLWCRIQFRSARYQGPATPITTQPTMVYPGYLGGMDWGSITVDPRRGIAYVPTVRMPNRNRLIPRKEADAMGLRPARPGEVRYLGGAQPQADVPYGVDVKPFLSPIGIPCAQPPYGMIAAIDLKTQKLIWQRPIGSAETNGPFGIPSKLPLTMGTPMMGGAINTAGGLIFMGATIDQQFRALEARTGKLLWKSRLPAGGNATPMTFVSPRTGRQYVVIAAGGNPGARSKPGNSIVAFALAKAK